METRRPLRRLWWIRGNACLDCYAEEGEKETEEMCRKSEFADGLDVEGEGKGTVTNGFQTSGVGH